MRGDNSYIGQKFGKLTILSEVEPIKDSNGDTRRVVQVICECGNISKKKLKYIKSGDTASCGSNKCRKKLVYGWGVNDVDYPVTRYEEVNGKLKQVWTCPYYKKWIKMLERCLGAKFQEKFPTYNGCTVEEDWKYLSNFIEWVDEQPNKDWQNCDLDKDSLYSGNKHYGPETTVFVSVKVNQFIKDRGRDRGDYMIGVCYCPDNNRKVPYMSRCSDPFGNNNHVGYYETELEAHKVWQAKKHEYACQLADLQEDERVAKALRERYAPDKDWANK